MDDAADPHIEAVAALDEPNRRRLYDHVIAQAAPVTRDEAAAAVGLARPTAAFHLDRLADAGLLDVVFERRTGKSGPGAGRPAKLYRRSDRQFTVSVPERRYQLAGELLAAAVDDATTSGESPRAVLNRRARELGERMGAGSTRPIADILRANGFEPDGDADRIVLRNCPFHALATTHTALVCSMNLSLLQGVLDGLGTADQRAVLEPETGFCCVKLVRS